VVAALAALAADTGYAGRQRSGQAAGPQQEGLCRGRAPDRGGAAQAEGAGLPGPVSRALGGQGSAALPGRGSSIRDSRALASGLPVRWGLAAQKMVEFSTIRWGNGDSAYWKP
jgi:hypothetical protein